jgi:hypothetical protein
VRAEQQTESQSCFGDHDWQKDRGEGVMGVGAGRARMERVAMEGCILGSWRWAGDGLDARRGTVGWRMDVVMVEEGMDQVDSLYFSVLSMEVARTCTTDPLPSSLFLMTGRCPHT